MNSFDLQPSKVKPLYSYFQHCLNFVISCVFSFFPVLDFRTLEIRLWYYKVKTFSPCLQSYSLFYFC